MAVAEGGRRGEVREYGRIANTPGSAGGAVAVGRTLATTVCRVADPMQVARPRQLRDASTVMRFQPARQSMINRRYDGRAPGLARQLRPCGPFSAGRKQPKKRGAMSPQGIPMAQARLKRISKDGARCACAITSSPPPSAAAGLLARCCYGGGRVKPMRLSE